MLPHLVLRNPIQPRAEALRFPQALERLDHLKKHNVGFNFYYPKMLNAIEFLVTDAALVNSCPVSSRLEKTILSLPIWPELTDEEVAYVCEVVQKFDMPVVAETGGKVMEKR